MIVTYVARQNVHKREHMVSDRLTFKTLDLNLYPMEAMSRYHLQLQVGELLLYNLNLAKF